MIGNCIKNSVSAVLENPIELNMIELSEQVSVLADQWHQRSNRLILHKENKAFDEDNFIAMCVLNFITLFSDGAIDQLGDRVKDAVGLMKSQEKPLDMNEGESLDAYVKKLMSTKVMGALRVFLTMKSRLDASLNTMENDDHINDLVGHPIKWANQLANYFESCALQCEKDHPLVDKIAKFSDKIRMLTLDFYESIGRLRLRKNSLDVLNELSWNFKDQCRGVMIAFLAEQQKVNGLKEDERKNLQLIAQSLLSVGHVSQSITALNNEVKLMRSNQEKVKSMKSFIGDMKQRCHECDERAFVAIQKPAKTQQFFRTVGQFSQHGMATLRETQRQTSAHRHSSWGRALRNVGTALLGLCTGGLFFGCKALYSRITYGRDTSLFSSSGKTSTMQCVEPAFNDVRSRMQSMAVGG